MAKVAALIFRGPVPAHSDRSLVHNRRQLTRIDEYPDRRDLSPADLCDHFAPGRRKTTLTEKLLLFGGVIQPAGEVKASGRRVRSDWMAVERERGISVSSAVMEL